MVAVLTMATVHNAVVINEVVRDYRSRAGLPVLEHSPLRPVLNFLRMNQNWNMFSPNPIRTDKWTIIGLELDDGRVIDPFTNQPPVIDLLSYETLVFHPGQFWRKYLSRVIKDNYGRYRPKLTSWISGPQSYFPGLWPDHEVVSVKIWSVSRRNPKPGESADEYQVHHTLIQDNSLPLQ